MKLGEVGEEERRSETRRRKADFESQAVLAENTSKSQIAASRKDLEVARSQYQQAEQVAAAEAKLMAERRSIELQTANEQLRRQQREAAQRATELAASTVKGESTVVDAQAKARQVEEQAKGNAAAAVATSEAAARVTVMTADAEAKSVQRKAEADAQVVRIRADADAASVQRLAEADAFVIKLKAAAEAESITMLAEAKRAAALKEAEGNRAKLEAQAKGNEALFAAASSNPDYAKLHRVLESNVAQELAEAGARAFHGMQPKVSMFLQGDAKALETGASRLGSALGQAGMSLVPWAKAFEEQTGVRIPGLSPPSIHASEAIKSA